jgi:DNA polymerase-3 subunit delta
MTYEEIIKNIRLRKYEPVYFLFGEEPYFIDVIADVLENEVLGENEKAFNQLVLYGKDTQIGAVVDEARQFPMMSDKKLVIIKEAQELKNWDDLIPYLEKPAPHSILIFCHKYKKPDKRTKFYKSLEKTALTFESKPLYENQIAAWVTKYVASKGFAIDPAAADLITDYIGSDLSKITNEIDKICIGLQPSAKITKDMVADQVGVIKEFNVFELSHAFGEKNFAKAALIIDYFCQSNKSGFLIPMVAQLHSFFYKVLIAGTHARENDANLAKLLGISTAYFVKDYRTAAKNYSPAGIKNILRLLMEADMKGKGIGSREDDAQLAKELLINVFYEPEVTNARAHLSSY